MQILRMAHGSIVIAEWIEKQNIVMRRFIERERDTHEIKHKNCWLWSYEPYRST